MFIPQNNVKPTLTRVRKCYFEIASAEMSSAFTLEFGGFLTETHNIAVSVDNVDPSCSRISGKWNGQLNVDSVSVRLLTFGVVTPFKSSLFFLLSQGTSVGACFRF
jgi:hypothetical protein